MSGNSFSGRGVAGVAEAASGQPPAFGAGRQVFKCVGACTSRRQASGGATVQEPVGPCRQEIPSRRSSRSLIDPLPAAGLPELTPNTRSQRRSFGANLLAKF